MRILPNTKMKPGFIQDERGTTAVVFALMAVPMVAIMGLALDFSRANGRNESLQEAVDSALLAAANAPNDQKLATAQKFFAANFDHSEASATSTFSLDSAGNITGVAHSTIAMPFASLAHLSATDVRVDASATTDTTSTTTNIVTTTTTTVGSVPCIQVMDQSGTGTFFMDSNSSLNASTCVVNVRSNNSQAMKDISSSNVKFKKIAVKGGALVSSGLTILDAPNTVLTQQSGANLTGDPYNAAVKAVSDSIHPGACTSSNTDKTWTGSVAPGTYCGATEFKNVTFGAGLYIIASASGNKKGMLKFSGSVNGNAGVSFYLSDNTAALVSYGTSENSKLAAPTSGPTKGLLFFESSNRGNSYSLTIANCNKQNWTGLVYMPSLNLKLESLSEWSGFNVALAVNQLTMKSLSSVMIPYRWTPYNATSPITLESTTVTTTHEEYQLIHRDGYLNH